MIQELIIHIAAVASKSLELPAQNNVTFYPTCYRERCVPFVVENVCLLLDNQICCVASAFMLREAIAR